ncbi:MAG: twin-arginine translocase TatA/TatE family subunit [Oscillibacter sp.]|nr:twin-arginine translocase TatA/TatE family subunit [Oscillibacter sp.]
MRIGVSELIVVLVVALLVLGPDKLPRYARKLGAALAEFRKASDEATREIRENVVEPLEEAQRPLREAMEPVEELDRAVKGNLDEVRTSLEGIGKNPPKPKPESVTNAAPEPEPVAGTTPEASLEGGTT